MFRLFFIQAIITLLIFTAGLCSAETIVRFSIQQSTAQDTVYLKLFDTEKPAIVNNFMSYVNDGSYNNSFIHRSIPGFIIQGGGYNFDPNDAIFIPSSADHILTKPPVDNSPGILNLHGTIAMARLPGNVDSATSEWFFNLADNSTNLVPNDGDPDAYTVFGEVLNDGMLVLDPIGVADTVSIAPFSALPLVDFLVEPILISNLIQLTSVEGIIKISPDHDFGIVTPKSNLQPEFFIENISDQNILIGGFGSNDPAESPFRVAASACDNSILLPGDKCFFVVSFRPLETNTYTDSFNIEFPALGLDYTMNITGEGGGDQSEPDISQAYSSFGFRTANYGEVDISAGTPITYTVDLGYQNLGSADLNFTLIDLVTSQADEFAMQGTCLDSSFLENSEVCSLILEFTPLNSGEKLAVIRIFSDDPDENPFDFTFTATATAENDGVEDAIEDAGPNNGDGNYDGILDSKQSNVVTLPGINGQYVTLVGSNDVRYRNVHFSDLSEFSPVPENVAALMGVLKFTVADLQLDEGVKVGMILPASFKPESYYVFGPKEESGESVWFEFSPDADSTTGAEIVTGASFITDDGRNVPSTLITLFLTNAVRGDSDFNADSELNVIGAFYEPPTGSSGRLHGLELLLLFFIIFCRSNCLFSKTIQS